MKQQSVSSPALLSSYAFRMLLLIGFFSHILGSSMLGKLATWGKLIFYAMLSKALP